MTSCAAVMLLTRPFQLEEIPGEADSEKGFQEVLDD